jgi:hypothetical protein
MGEQDRHRLLQRLREVLGEEEAATLMENLPPLPWSDLATRADLDRFATKADLDRFATKTDLDRFATKTDLDRFATKADLDRFATKTDLATEVKELRGDISEIDVRVRTLDASLSMRFERSEAEMEAVTHRLVSSQTRVLLLGLIGSVLTAAAIAFSAAAW